MNRRFLLKLCLSISVSLLLLNGCGFKRDPQIEETVTVQESYYEPFTVAAFSINESGDLLLESSPQHFNMLGYEAGDVISVRISEKSFDVPILAEGTDGFDGELICLFLAGADNHDQVVLSFIDGSFFERAGLKEEDKSVTVSMKEKQGYPVYESDEAFYLRRPEREEYPHLNDEEFANFREVKGEKIGEGVLYRSSSPINAKLSRNTYADQALKDHGIRTVFNMADHQIMLPLHEYYKESFYQDCELITLNMPTYVFNNQFESQLKQGLCFLLEHESPWLIHCTEGKDRTGFAVALLEALMGEKADAIISDYMKTYFNYYGIPLGSLVYHRIAERTICRQLMRAFDLDSLDEEADLSEYAGNYLIRIGLDEEMVAQLRQRLSEE